MINYTQKDILLKMMYLSSNASLTLEIMQIIDSKSSSMIWNWYQISYNTHLHLDVIDNYSDKFESWIGISSNKNLTMDFVNKYPDKDWDWYEISRNPNITLDTIISNKNVNLSGISINPNLTFDFVKSNSDLKWDWMKISKNKFNKHPYLMKKERLQKTKCWKSIVLKIEDL